jgi:hypothetical protein
MRHKHLHNILHFQTNGQDGICYGRNGVIVGTKPVLGVVLFGRRELLARSAPAPPQLVGDWGEGQTWAAALTLREQFAALPLYQKKRYTAKRIIILLF